MFDHVFYQWGANRIRKNKNLIIVVNGPTGSGKTYSAISMAEIFSKKLKTNFNVEDNIEFNFKKLLHKMELPKNQKPGTVFLFEEVGAFGGGASSREWQSQANKFFFSFMQTSRHRNQILIMTCPNFSFLERGARSLAHMQMQTNGIDFQNKIAWLKPYRVQINSRTGQFYFKYLRFTYDRKKYKLDRLNVPYPSQDLVDKYEVVKRQYTDELNLQIRQSEDKNIKKRKVSTKAIEIFHKQSYSSREIAEVLDVSIRTVQVHLKKIKERDLEQNKPFSLGK